MNKRAKPFWVKEQVNCKKTDVDPSKPQLIVWPWNMRWWAETRNRISEPIKSIVELDTMMTSIQPGKLRPRSVTELLSIYYDQPTSEKITEDILLTQVVPTIQELIRTAHKLFKKTTIRALVSGAAANVALTRPQIAAIIAAMWFNLFEYRYITKGAVPIDEFSIPSFINVFEHKNIFAFHCLLNYFWRVHKYMHHPDQNIKAQFNNGVVIFKRHILDEDSTPDWINSTKSIAEVLFTESPEVMPEDTLAKLHIVPCTEYIGGGDLFAAGLTAEEIIMLTKTECLAATLFCARLKRNECITIIGAEKFSQYSGTGSGVRFVGDHLDITPLGISPNRTEENIRQSAAVFIDASPRIAGVAQFVKDFDRDLNKAYCGMTSVKLSAASRPTVASAHWAYVHNSNNMQLKFFQLLLAASEAGLTLVYFPIDKDFELQVERFLSWVQRCRYTVKELYGKYVEVLQECYIGPGARLADLDLFAQMQSI